MKTRADDKFYFRIREKFILFIIQLNELMILFSSQETFGTKRKYLIRKSLIRKLKERFFHFSIS
ncbi:hypothetical protein BpHYR1_015055 [Brachionus plicatilis]|uniref:Uncharacterized protein n=1 Tax=Brachionus plicatilis TaxID=10195 RepID=A0A3M7P627_BRAPC|nr:hypothetical protein BpHYR1_015055 [Brachionus plicatilis]